MSVKWSSKTHYWLCYYILLEVELYLIVLCKVVHFCSSVLLQEGVDSCK